MAKPAQSHFCTIPWLIWTMEIVAVSIRIFVAADSTASTIGHNSLWWWFQQLYGTLPRTATSAAFARLPYSLDASLPLWRNSVVQSDYVFVQLYAALSPLHKVAKQYRRKSKAIERDLGSPVRPGNEEPEAGVVDIWGIVDIEDEILSSEDALVTEWVDLRIVETLVETLVETFGHTASERSHTSLALLFSV
ncbi:hypothetical protein TWF751_007066 [Orbilia oligospora]|nr:hypothetical protein TWF751_007066 [Orbilia oligospora]